MSKKDIHESTLSGTVTDSEGRGRPVKHEGATQNITVIFGQDTADRLRRECIKMKKTNGSNFSMNEFIRPVVEAVLESDLDLSMADSEDELKELLLSKLM